jgi:drug/metabolite transporter (DMT)-like permease
MTILLLALTSIVTATSQTLFKQTLTAKDVVFQTGKGISGFIASFAGLLMSPSFLGALFLYGLAFVLWISLLSRTQLSVIYPIGIALNVLLTLMTARFILGEPITFLHALGVAVILLGMVLIMR